MPEPTLSELDERLTKLQAQIDGAGASANPPVSLGKGTSQAGTAAPQLTPAPPPTLDPLQQLDARIAQSSPNEALALLIVRERLVTQLESQEDRRHVRSLERRNLYAKVALSFTAFAGGVFLVVGVT